jgi:ubiquinone biosynthesis protein UbiJ
VEALEAERDKHLATAVEESLARDATEAKVQELAQELAAEETNHRTTRQELQRHIDQVTELEREVARLKEELRRLT